MRGIYLEWPVYTRIFVFWDQTSDIGMRVVSCPKFNIHRFWDFGSKVRKLHGNARVSLKMPKIQFSKLWISDPNFENWMGT